MGLGDWLSNVLGTNSQVSVGPQQALNQWNFTPETGQGLTGFRSADAGQQQLASQLQQQAAGGGPNPAASMLQAAQDQAAAQAMNVYSNNRAINPALAARQASMLQAQQAGQAANQAATLRAQQQLNTQGQLAQVQGNRAQQNLGLYGAAQQGNAQQNSAINSANAINAGIAAGNQQQAGNIVGGIMNGVGAAAGLAHANGGMIQPLAAGGAVQPPMNAFSAAGKGMMTSAPASGPQSNVGRFLAMAGQPTPYSSGGSVGSKLKSGGAVPGKAKVSGDSLRNDSVPAMLSPGEIVIPRSVIQSKDAPEKARAFVAAILARQSLGRKK
jgi:hypothetical protein